ncbi:MAG: hypothetical protein JNM75_14030 [Rhodospirillales bacterium]|nr:hypothetical protein [Rhodospirillales bacterium]
MRLFAEAGRASRADPSVSLFLGLYLLILAFFILLVSLSTIEEKKARAVMESLSTTFGSERPAGSALGISGGDGSLPVVQNFLAALARIVRVAELKTLGPGRLMRVSLPMAVVFAAGAETPRPSLYPLLDRTVATLSAPPPGLRVDFEFALAPGATVAGQALAARRADVFAREMLARGAPPARLSIALAPAAGDEAWLTFRIESTAAAAAPAAGAGR